MTEDTAPLAYEEHTFAAIKLTFHDHIFTITLSRPEKKNAINQTMVNELIYALDFAKETRDVRVVIIAAEGDVFCAGGDLKAMSGAAQGALVSTIPHLGESDDMVIRLYNLGKPVIAKLQGPVLAGALLIVCNATHAIAADQAFFSAPEIKRGLWPFQVMAGLFRVMPRRTALDFIMRGDRMPAEDAVRLGLINKSVPGSELDEHVNFLAKELSALAPGSMQMGLSAYRALERMSFDEALPFLKTKFVECLGTEDAKEGLAAFAEKRSPQWS